MANDENQSMLSKIYSHFYVFFLPLFNISLPILHSILFILTGNSKMCTNSNEQISPAKWKSMEEESLHMISNKTLAVHLQNLDKISIINDSNKFENIECIDEEIIHSPNLNSDDIYEVMWICILSVPTNTHKQFKCLFNMCNKTKQKCPIQHFKCTLKLFFLQSFFLLNFLNFDLCQFFWVDGWVGKVVLMIDFWIPSDSIW